MLNERLLLLNLRDVKSVSYRNVDYKVYININYYNGEVPFAYNADFSDFAHKDYKVEQVREVYEKISDAMKKGELYVEIDL
jgi:hypothetical protein